MLLSFILILANNECSFVTISGSGASTDIKASHTARVMVISVIPFIIIQLSLVLHTTSQICLAVLISLIICISLLLAYCLYQVFVPLNSDSAACRNIFTF